MTRYPYRTMDRLLDVVLRCVVIGVLALAATGVCGCAQRQAQRFTSVTAEGVERTDERVALRYTAASQEAIDAAESMAEFEELMQPWDRAEAAIRGARGSLFALQAALNTWKATGDRSGFNNLAPCLLGELANLRRVLEEVGEQVPEELLKALKLGELFAGGGCDE